MLAQNFLSHETLGITQDEWAALIRVLGMMQREEVPFSMMEWPDDFHQCGTPACIGGWTERELGREMPTMGSSFAVPSGLRDLFFMESAGGWDRHGDVTHQQAAIALRSYLTTGDPSWKEALTA